MLITQDMYHAAFAKLRGAKLGKITKAENGRANIELLGEKAVIEIYIAEYERGGRVDTKKFVEELGFIKYIVMSKIK
jgi:hypothetical protein